MNWIQMTDRLPDKRGVYLVTILNREWTNYHTIEDGMPPIRDENWESHANLYGQLPDGRWVTVEQRVYDPATGVWTGYEETVLAWQPMPDPFGVNKQITLF